MVWNMYKFSNSSNENLKGVDFRLVQVANLALRISKVDFGISSGVRTAKEQKELFIKGSSQLDGVNQKSKHQLGLAVDFFAYVDGKTNYDDVNMQTVALAFFEASSILDVRILWGGHWKSFVDLPHIELR